LTSLAGLDYVACRLDVTDYLHGYVRGNVTGYARGKEQERGQLKKHFAVGCAAKINEVWLFLREKAEANIPICTQPPRDSQVQNGTLPGE
jgi:hypothetical protein